MSASFLGLITYVTNVLGECITPHFLVSGWTDVSCYNVESYSLRYYSVQFTEMNLNPKGGLK